MPGEVGVRRDACVAADPDRTRDIREIAGPSSADIEEHRLAGTDHASARLMVRRGAVGPDWPRSRIRPCHGPPRPERSRTSLATSASVRPTSGTRHDALTTRSAACCSLTQQLDLLGVLDPSQGRQRPRGQLEVGVGQGRPGGPAGTRRASHRRPRCSRRSPALGRAHGRAPARRGPRPRPSSAMSHAHRAPGPGLLAPRSPRAWDPRRWRRRAAAMTSRFRRSWPCAA